MFDVFKCDICGQYIDEVKNVKGLCLCENCIGFCPVCKEEVPAHTIVNGVCKKCNTLED